MRNSSFRIHVSTGTFTLPIVASLMVLLWILSDITNLSLWIGLGGVTITVILLAELSNRNALIRVRSRMPSAVFLAMYTMCPSLHFGTADMIPMVCLLLGYFHLFQTYQHPHPEGSVFISFLCLGISSFFYPPLIFCAIALYFSLLVPLRALTWRTWFAGIFGLLLPYWFYAGWSIWNETISTAFLPWLQSFHYSWTGYATLPSDVLSTAALLIALAVPAVFHFSHTAYNDKIRTRMYYYAIISVEVFLLAGLLLQPQHYSILLSLLIANSTPLIAHHFALGKGKILDYGFIIYLTIWGALTILNNFDLWTLLSNF